MKLGMVGLGKMGASMTARLLAAGHRLVVFDRNSGAMKASAQKGALASESLSDLVSKLEPPRVAWVMVPAGDATTSVIEERRFSWNEETSSSTEATATTKTRCAAPQASRKEASLSWMWERAAASGASPRDTA